MCSAAAWELVTATNTAGMWYAIGSHDPWAVVLLLRIAGTSAQSITAGLRRWFPEGTLAIVAFDTKDRNAHTQALLSGYDVRVERAAGLEGLRAGLTGLFTGVSLGRSNGLTRHTKASQRIVLRRKE